MKHKVTLKPSGIVVEVEEGINLLQALREQEIYIKSSCGGVASCSDCVVKVTSGEDYLTPPPFSEIKLLGNVFHITKERLSCQTCITGDVTLDITRHDKATDQEKLRAKTSFSPKKTNFKVKKESEVKEASNQKNLEKLQTDQVKKSEENKWQKHWEKDQSGQKKLAGNRRPKFFDTTKVDYEKKDFTRPLDESKKNERREKEESNQLNDQGDKKEFKKFRS